MYLFTCSYEGDVRVNFHCATSPFFLLVFGHTSFVPSGKSLNQFPLGVAVWSQLRVLRLQVHLQASSLCRVLRVPCIHCFWLGILVRFREHCSGITLIPLSPTSTSPVLLMALCQFCVPSSGLAARLILCLRRGVLRCFGFDSRALAFLSKFENPLLSACSWIGPFRCGQIERPFKPGLRHHSFEYKVSFLNPSPEFLLLSFSGLCWERFILRRL